MMKYGIIKSKELYLAEIETAGKHGDIHKRAVFVVDGRASVEFVGEDVEKEGWCELCKSYHEIYPKKIYKIVPQGDVKVLYFYVKVVFGNISGVQISVFEYKADREIWDVYLYKYKDIKFEELVNIIREVIRQYNIRADVRPIEKVLDLVKSLKELAPSLLPKKKSIGSIGNRGVSIGNFTISYGQYIIKKL